jgi:hypothetical protein
MVDFDSFSSWSFSFLFENVMSNVIFKILKFTDFIA